jgi:hypothetical protein
MREGVKWTDLTRREISQRLAERGTPAGKRVVRQLLKRHGYVKRKARKSQTMGPRHPDRNAQRVTRQRIEECQVAVLPNETVVLVRGGIRHVAGNLPLRVDRTREAERSTK